MNKILKTTCLLIIGLTGLLPAINATALPYELERLWLSHSVEAPKEVLARLMAEFEQAKRQDTLRSIRLLNSAKRMALMIDSFADLEHYDQQIKALLKLTDNQSIALEVDSMHSLALELSGQFIAAEKKLTQLLEQVGKQRLIHRAWLYYRLAKIKKIGPIGNSDQLAKFLDQAEVLYRAAEDNHGLAYLLVIDGPTDTKKEAEFTLYTEKVMDYVQLLADPVLEQALILKRLSRTVYQYNGSLNKTLTKSLNKDLYQQQAELKAIAQIEIADNLYLFQGKLNAAIPLYQEGMAYMLKRRWYRMYFAATLMLGYLYKDLGEFDRAIETIIPADKIAREIGDTNYQALFAGNMALSYRRAGKVDKAIEQIRFSLNLYLEAKDFFNAAGSHLNLFDAYRTIKNEEQSNYHIQQAIKLAQQTNNHSAYALALAKYGMLLVEAEQYQAGIEQLLKAEALANEHGYRRRIEHVSILLSSAYQAIGELEKAAFYGEKTITINEGAKQKKEGHLLHVHEQLVAVYEELKQFEKAFTHLQKINQYYQNKIESDSNKIFAEVSEKYETEKKAKEIALLKQQNQLKEAEFRNKALNQKLWTVAISISALVLLLLAIILLIRRENRRVKEQVAEKTSALKQSTVEMRNLFTKYVNLYQNFSHEFRTPINIIAGNLKRLHKESDETKKQFILDTVERNTQGLIQLIEQIIELSKLQTPNSQQITTHPTASIKTISDYFVALAEKDDKRIIVELDDDSRRAIKVAPSAFEQIVKNLISNAIKYTLEGATIKLKAYEEKDNFVFSVWDNGIGISDADSAHIFDRFHRCDTEYAQTVSGTGLGLAIVKEHIDHCSGSIKVDSQLNEYTCFTISIPCAENSTCNSFSNQLDHSAIKVEVEALLNASDERSHPDTTALPSTTMELPVCLVVEDNIDMQTLIVSILQENYRVVAANNGLEALTIARQLVPDIVVSDIDMPKKDGFVLLQDLKSLPETSHVPVLLLTAKTDADSRIKSWQYSADGYIAKPFEQNELLALCQGLLNNRRMLRSIWSQTDSDETVLDSLSLDFIDKFNGFLEVKLSDSDLKVNDIASHLGMSTRSFQRKTKSITGQSPAEYIRHFRLEKSKQYILNGMPISQVYYDVGFTSHSYFSRAYKDHFGVPPSRHGDKLN